MGSIFSHNRCLHCGFSAMEGVLCKVCLTQLHRSILAGPCVELPYNTLKRLPLKKLERLICSLYAPDILTLGSGQIKTVYGPAYRYSSSKALLDYLMRVGLSYSR